MLVGCNSRFGRVGGAGQGAESAARGEMQGKIGKRRHPSPLSVHRNPRRGREPGMETKSITGGVSYGKGWGSRGRALQGPGTGAETWGCPEQWEALPWGSAGLSGVRKSFCV